MSESTLDEVMTTEQRLRDRANAGNPESWKPEPGQELTGKVTRYGRAYTSRGDHVWIMIVESLRTPGRFLSVWLLHTTLRNEVIEQQPRPGEVVYLRYEGMQAPKGGGDEYHGWKLVIDRDEAANPTFGFPWQTEERHTAADEVAPYTGPPRVTEETQYQPGEPSGGGATDWPAADDDIPF